VSFLHSLFHLFVSSNMRTRSMSTSLEMISEEILDRIVSCLDSLPSLARLARVSKRFIASLCLTYTPTCLSLVARSIWEPEIYGHSQSCRSRNHILRLLFSLSLFATSMPWNFLIVRSQRSPVGRIGRLMLTWKASSQLLSRHMVFLTRSRKNGLSSF
jgi:hypothetical protein